MVDPFAPDFTRSDRHWALALDALDDLDQFVRGQVGTQQRFVADKDRVDVAVMAGEFERGPDFARVTVLAVVDPGIEILVDVLEVVLDIVLVDPRADRDLKAKLCGDRGNEFGAAGRRIKTDRVSVRRDRLQIGSYLFGRRTLAGIRM